MDHIWEPLDPEREAEMDQADEALRRLAKNKTEYRVEALRPEPYGPPLGGEIAMRVVFSGTALNWNAALGMLKPYVDGGAEGRIRRVQ